MIVCVAVISKMGTRQTIHQYSFLTAVPNLSGSAMSVGVYVNDVEKVRMSSLSLSIINVGAVQKYVQCCIAVYVMYILRSICLNNIYLEITVL
jgi:hypothetical protein